MDASPSLHSTPLPIIASVTKTLTKATDRLTGDRNDYPTLLCLGIVYALKKFNISSSIWYGEAAWIECLKDHSILWTGAWGENFHFWVQTQFSEIVDLNTSVSYRKKFSSDPEKKPILSPPLLWSSEIPLFYRYKPIGFAEIEPEIERDQKWLQFLYEEIDEKIKKEDESKIDFEFPNEAIICPGKKLLDDSKKSFQSFDEHLQKTGLPQAPF